MKIYLGGPMFTKSQIEYNLKLSKLLRSKGFYVYCPNENVSINDKTRTDITGPGIYQADIIELESSNVFLCQVYEDSGTMWEAGYMDCLSKHVDGQKYYGVIGLATDIRLSTLPDPQKPGIDNQTFYINQFIAGGIKLSLGIFLDEESLVQKLIEVQEQREGAQ